MNDELVRVDGPDETPLLWLLQDVPNMAGTRFGAARLHCTVCVIALLSTFGSANAISSERAGAVHEMQCDAQKRWKGKYDFERNQRAVYAACMYSHGQPQ